MKKLIISILFMVIFLPNVIKADGITVNCPTRKNAGSSFSCTVVGNSSSGPISGFQSVLSLSSGISCSGATSSNFNITYNSNSLVAAPKGSEFMSSGGVIATLNCALSSSASGNQTLTLTNNKMGVEVNNVTQKNNLANVSKTIHVNSTDNNLTSLSLSNASISPSFSLGNLSYTATIDADKTTVSATTSNGATITGTGVINLNYGKNTITVNVTSESGAVKKYTIVVTRPDNRETVNTLSSLSISNTTISAAFSSSRTSYSATVEANISSVTINSRLSSSKSSYTAGSSAYKVNLNYGSNVFRISVKAENGSIKTYTITITRKDNRSTDNTLDKITVSSGNITFDKNTTTYSINVPYETESIDVDAVASSSKAKVVIENNKLNFGNNTITIKVSAENGSEKTYTINVNRSSEKAKVFSKNNNLKSLTIENYSINFDKDNKSYNIKIEEENSLNIKYETEDELATVVIKNNENLQNKSVIEVIVTAENGETNTYKININKTKPFNYMYIITFLIGLIVGMSSMLVVNVIKKKKITINK